METLLAFAIVAVAAGWVLSRIVKKLTAAPRSACGSGCSGCPSATASSSRCPEEAGRRVLLRAPCATFGEKAEE